MADKRADQYIAVTAGRVAMEAAESIIKAEAERTGSMWLPRIDPSFMKAIRREYRSSGASPKTVDALLAYFSEEAQRSGLSPGLFWVTAFQAVVALEMIASVDGLIAEGKHPLLEHFTQRQKEATQS